MVNPGSQISLGDGKNNIVFEERVGGRGLASVCGSRLGIPLPRFCIKQKTGNQAQEE